jgi:hypothetical protein
MNSGSLSFSTIGADDAQLPALSAQSLYDEGKVVNRNAGGGGALVEERAQNQSQNQSQSQNQNQNQTQSQDQSQRAMPPVYFPATQPPRGDVLGVAYPVAFLVLASNIITLLISILLILVMS